MITAKRAVALFLVSALCGCTGSRPSEVPVDDPPPPAATATATAAPAPEVAEPVVEDKVAVVPEEPADPPGTAAPSLVIQHMPADCDRARVYINASRIVTAEVESSLDGIVSTLIGEATKAGKTDAKKAQAALKALKDGGLDPVRGVDEIAVCSNGDETRNVVAIAFDMSKAGKPAEVIARALTAATGKKPVRAEVDGVTYFQPKAEGPWLAVVGKDRLVLADSKEAAIVAVKGGANGDRGFAIATRNVLWFKVDEKSVELRVREVGDIYQIGLRARLGDEAGRAAAEFEKARPELGKLSQKMPSMTPLLPAARNAKVSASGGMLIASTELSKSAFATFLNGLQGQGLKDLLRTF